MFPMRASQPFRQSSSHGEDQDQASEAITPAEIEMMQETQNNFFQNLFFLERLEKIMHPCLKHQDVSKKK